MSDKLMQVDKCVTCSVKLVERGFVRFPCPNCGEGIGRCVSCRNQGNAYVCPSCGFGGP
ncbi:MAG: zinc finger domain-containing protein [Candidatus Syntrophoarchaeum sp.]|nr:zinc finger domain-containing protein [Candidatus Syntrophoarchaeum sp.]